MTQRPEPIFSLDAKHAPSATPPAKLLPHLDRNNRLFALKRFIEERLQGCAALKSKVYSAKLETECRYHLATLDIVLKELV